MQREIPILSNVPKPVMAPWDLVHMCKNRLEAIQLCAQLSRLSHETIAQQLGIDKGHWSRIMHGKANLPDTKSVAFMTLCGNLAPLQYEAWAMQYDLVERSAEVQLRTLQRELSLLRGVAA